MNKNRKIGIGLPLTLTAVLLLTILSGMAHTADATDGSTGTPDTSWYNTTDMSFKISTADELAGLSVIVCDVSAGYHITDNFYGKTITLMSDIDLSSYANWQPIGLTNMYPFRGTFDGNNHVIKNLNINSSDRYCGLFGYLGTTDKLIPDCGTIENLGVINGSVTGLEYVSGVVGAARYGCIVKNCYNAGVNVTGVNFVGGVVGYGYSAVSNCYNNSTIRGSGAQGGVGGVIGNTEGTLTECYNTGNIFGAGRYLGGVVGVSFGTVSNCYNMGKIDSDTTLDVSLGGVVGTNSGQTLNCYNAGDISSNGGIGSSVGGVVGTNNSANGVLNCYSAGIITSNCASTGGVVGTNSNTSGVSNCYYDVDNYPSRGIGNGNGLTTCLTTIEMLTGDTLASSFMSSLGSAFVKSPGDSNNNYRPELSLFKNSTDPTVRAASKLSVTVAKILPGVTATAITYGQKLSTSTLSGTTNGGTTPVSGAFAWVNGAIVPPASNTIAYSYTFTPSDILYKAASGTVKVTVNKLSITITPDGGQSKAAGSDDPKLTYSLSPALISGDTLTGALGRASGETAGTYAISLGTLSAGNNYSLTIKSGVVFTITPSGMTYYNITTSSDGGSTMTPDGAVVQAGNDQTISFSANDGYKISSVTVDGTPLSQAQIASGSYTFSKIDGDHTIDVKSTVTGSGGDNSKGSAGDNGSNTDDSRDKNGDTSSWWIYALIILLVIICIIAIALWLKRRTI